MTPDEKGRLTSHFQRFKNQAQSELNPMFARYKLWDGKQGTDTIEQINERL